MHQRLPSLRLLLIYFTCISVNLGTAVSAMGRLMLYLLALVVLLQSLRSPSSDTSVDVNIKRTHWIYLTIATVGFMALTLVWSQADPSKALGSWSRHARLITIPIVWMLLRNRSEAQSALRVFIWALLFVVASSWLLVWHVPVPWATAYRMTDNVNNDYVVFGSYLEQSIMEAMLVFLLWYQRHWIFGTKGRWFAIAAALLTAVHMLSYVPGRSGHLVLLALASLAITYALPKKRRWIAIATPILVALLVFTLFPSAKQRMMLVYSEVIAYSQHADIKSSSGERLFYWLTSWRSISDHPWLGSGSGSWNHELHRLAGQTNIESFQTVDNPHQMFFLWGVEAGLIGLLLLCATLISLYHASRSLDSHNARSLQSMLAALVVAGLTTSTIYGIGMGDFFCVLIGILLATERVRDHVNLNPAITSKQA